VRKRKRKRNGERKGEIREFEIFAKFIKF